MKGTVNSATIKADQKTTTPSVIPMAFTAARLKDELKQIRLATRVN